MDNKSLGQWVGAILGTVVGVFTGNIMLGMAIGMAIGGFIDPPKGPSIEGPRLNDLSAQVSTLGAPMGRVYGTVGIEGNVFWLENNELKEVVTKKKQGGKGGGKGGAESKTYTYFATFAIGLCRGPVDGVRRIWIGNDLIYNSGSTELGTIIASNSTGIGGTGFKAILTQALIQHVHGNKGIKFAFYPGTADQLPDPRIEADLGTNKAPAFRGLAYIVFHDLPLERYGNSLLGATVKVEVVRNGVASTVCEPVSEWTENLEGRTSAALHPVSIMVRDGRIYNMNEAGEIEKWSTQGNFQGIEPWNMALFKTSAVSPHNPFLRLVKGLVEPDVGRLFVTQEYGQPGAGPLVTTAGHYLGGALRSGKVLGISGTNDEFIVMEKEQDGSGRVVIARYSGMNAPDQEVGAPDGAITNDHTAPMIFAMGYVWLLVHPDRLIRYDPYDLTSTKTWEIHIGGLYSQSFAIVGSILYMQTGLGDHSTRAFSLNDDGTVTVICTIAAPADSISNLDDTIAYTSSASTPARFFSPGLQRGGTQLLSDVVQEELLLSELIRVQDIDVSSLTDVVYGYRLGGVQQVRAVLAPLQGAYPFDIIPSGYQIKAVRRGQSSMRTIDIGELNARPYGTDEGIALEQPREMDTQLPRKVILKYLDANREYEMNEQYSPERLSSKAVNVREFEMPLVLNANQAAGIAEVLQYVPWQERTGYSFKLGPEYRELEPADVITITAPYGNFVVRLSHVAQMTNGTIECIGKPDSPASWTPNALGEEGVTPNEEVGLASGTVVALMDIPLIRDTDNTPGFAAAMSGTTYNWDGGVLFRSIDNEQTWQALQGWSSPVTMGVTRSPLTAHDGLLIDRQSTLQVDLNAGQLESITEAQLLSGLHWAAYGADQRWELIRFANADLQADNSYIMSTFIRGARGTEWATGLHLEGDTFVLLDDADVTGVLTGVETLNLPFQWAGVSAGQDTTSAQSFPFAYRGANLRPLSPCKSTGGRSGAAWRFDATRRSRMTTSWWKTGIERQLGEATEAWEVDILDDATVVRTLQSPTLPMFYTEEQQIADWGSVQTEITASLAQMSATAGKGFPLTLPYDVPAVAGAQWAGQTEPLKVIISGNSVTLVGGSSHTSGANAGSEPIAFEGFTRITMSFEKVLTGSWYDDDFTDSIYSNGFVFNTLRENVVFNDDPSNYGLLRQSTPTINGDWLIVEYRELFTRTPRIRYAINGVFVYRNMTVINAGTALEDIGHVTMHQVVERLSTNTLKVSIYANSVLRYTDTYTDASISSLATGVGCATTHFHSYSGSSSVQTNNATITVE